MANADIRQLEMDGKVFYPQTDIHGLVNNGGYAIDDEPTQESSNLVTSDSVYRIKSETLQENREMVNSIMEDYAPVEIHGDVTNAADEEDLTSVNVSGTDVLKFKDKVYNQLVYSGLGRKILRKNMVNGVNTLSQSMINDENTIYVIQYDFVLGENIIIPANCILEFDGGSISNGTVIGDNTGIEAGLDNIFNIDITFSGTWNVADIFPEWFGAKGDGVTNDYVSLQLMFDSLNTCLPQIQVTSDNTVRDYRKTSIKFTGTYLTNRPIVLKSAFGLILSNLNLQATNDFEAIAYSPWSDQMKGLINIVGIQYHTVIDSCIFDGNAKADCLALYDYTLDTNISKCYIRRFVEYGIYGTLNGYELKIDNTKIGQREYNSELNVYSQGTGIYLESGRNDNNFENVIICYCATCSFNLKSGTNYIANSHFYSGDKYSEIANVNTINNCYFDGEGLKSGGANTIRGCYFGANVIPQEGQTPPIQHTFIELSNAGEPIAWIYEMECIENNTFRSNTETLLGKPIGVPEGVSDDILDQLHISCFNNLFWSVTKYLSYSPSIDTVKPLKTSEVKSHIKSIQHDLTLQSEATDEQMVMLFAPDGTPNGKTLINMQTPSDAADVTGSIFTLEKSSNPKFSVYNRAAAEMYEANMGGYGVIIKNNKLYAAKLNRRKWDSFEDGTLISSFPNQEADFETMIHVPDCHYLGNNKTLNFGGLTPVKNGHVFDSPRWVGAYAMYVDGNGKGHSRPGVSPTGDKTVLEFWNCAQSLNTNFGLANYQFFCLINALFQARFGNLDSTGCIGKGFGTIEWEYVKNSIPMGLTKDLGDGTGSITYPHKGPITEDQHPVKLFGFEDLWGKLFEYRPGIRFFMDDNIRKVIVYSGNVVSNTAAGREIVCNAMSSAYSGTYITDMELGEYWDMLVQSVSNNWNVPGDNEYYCDIYSYDSQGETLRVGGTAAFGSFTGASYGNRDGITISTSNTSFTYHNPSTGARLALYGEPEIVSGAKLLELVLS